MLRCPWNSRDELHHAPDRSAPRTLDEIPWRRHRVELRLGVDRPWVERRSARSLLRRARRRAHGGGLRRRRSGRGVAMARSLSSAQPCAASRSRGVRGVPGSVGALGNLAVRGLQLPHARRGPAVRRREGLRRTVPSDRVAGGLACGGASLRMPRGLPLFGPSAARRESNRRGAVHPHVHRGSTRDGGLGRRVQRVSNELRLSQLHRERRARRGPAPRRGTTVLSLR